MWHTINYDVTVSNGVNLCRPGISPPPSTVDILTYPHDARIDTKRNTIRRFMIANNSMQETHSIVLIQRPDSANWLPTGKTSIALLSALSVGDLP